MEIWQPYGRKDQILTGHPIDLKLVANGAGWILMNLQIPQAQRLSALICIITIMMLGGAESAPPSLSRVKVYYDYVCYEEQR